MPTQTYKSSTACGKVTYSDSADNTFGPEIEVTLDGVTWAFGIDLFNLAVKLPDVRRIDSDTPANKRCVQIVCRKPATPEDPDASEGDPVKTVRVYSDGEVETFIC